MQLYKKIETNYYNYNKLLSIFIDNNKKINLGCLIQDIKKFKESKEFKEYGLDYFFDDLIINNYEKYFI